MKNFFLRYATPLITGLFLVSLISGVALFFHVGTAWFHGMHEWLSVALILPFVLHVWKNWRPFTNYFRHLPMTVALLVSVLGSAYFIWPSSEPQAGGPPQFAFTRDIIKNPLSQVAPLLGDTSDNLVKHLNEQGFSAAAADLALIDIATKSGKSEGQLIQAIIPARQ